MEPAGFTSGPASNITQGQTTSTYHSSSFNIAYAIFLVLIFILPLAWAERCKTHSLRLFHKYGSKVLMTERPWSLALLSSLQTYISRLKRSTFTFIYHKTLKHASPILSIKLFSRRLLIADPSMESTLAKHASETSLAHVMSIVGHRLFNLSDDTIHSILEYDPRSVHAHEFSSSANSREHIEQASAFANQRMENQPDVQEVELGSWVFKLTIASLASTLWGVDNPWSVDEEFVSQFIILNKSLAKLLRPFPQVTATQAHEARRFLVNRLQQSHHKTKDAAARPAAHRINIVARTDPEWESNPDYFNIKLLLSLALIVTPSSMAVWLVRHLLTDRSVLDEVISEVRNPILCSNETGMMDSCKIRENCPMLVASLHETMRLHMTAIPRLATQDFELATPFSTSPKPTQVKKGDMMLLPMSSFNKDPATWGPNAESFSPQRFLSSSGSVSASTVRKVRAFGVAGNLCPGKKIGFETVLFVVATLLRSFDVTTVMEGNFEAFDAPSSEDGFGFGFEACGGDVKAVLRRRK